ncbi:hypothetical protein NFI96_016460, partial [Prochilodus magdalenae]
GAPLSELSWPSSLAVVAVSFSGLFTFVFLMLACLCCKKGDISFKEFENTEGEEYQADLSTLASPGSQDGPDVYILPLTEVSLPVAKQPGRSIQLLKSADLGRHSLLYLKEIGQEWFGKVLLGEVNAGLSTTQVVVKELKASASVQDQMQFLEEAQPYRTLHHPALLQCLAQCTEVTPYLLIMEYCPLGDVKGYLRGCRADSATPDPLILQRMACEIASGLLYLHKHNYIHSDLALRNCLLTPEMTVKIGDYGLSHSRYKDDYFVTADQIWVPLRWIAPELIDEVHGNLLVVDQTKASNVWSLGVTIWELFELGNQPYRHYSDRQVLTYAVKEQQLKLPKPLLKVPLSDRWYEVMQFCWLQPEQRPMAEEVNLLLNYLCAKGTSEAEEDFEKRWNSLRPSLGTSSSHRTPTSSEVASSTSSFPLLEHFSTADSFQSENGDDILTVTETSHGLNFEYKWEQARAEQPYCSSSASGPLGRSNPHYQDIYYPLSSTTGSCKGESLTLGVSPSYYESDHPGVVPVLSAHSPSVSSEYYIRIEEPVECNINLEEGTLDYSPRVRASNSCFSTNDIRSPTEAQTNSYWSAAKDSKSSAYDSDGSPTISLTLEPLQRGRLSPLESADQSSQYLSPSETDRFHCEQSISAELEAQMKRGQAPDSHLGSGSHHYTRVQVSPHGVAVSLSSPSLGHCDPYLEASQRTAEKSMSNETYYDMMGNLQKNMPRPHYMSIDVEAGDGLLMAVTQEELLTDRSTSPAQDVKLRSEGPATLSGKKIPCPTALSECVLECSHIGDSWVESGCSSVSLVDIDDCSDDDIADITSGVFPESPVDYAEVGDGNLVQRPLHREMRSCDTEDIIDLASSSSPCEAFMQDAYNMSIQPKSLDSGYDTENNESPEFIMKDLEGKPVLSTSVESECEMVLQMQLNDDVDGVVLTPACNSNLELTSLGERNQYRDSAYFSDYDTENDKSPCEGGSAFFDNQVEDDVFGNKPAKDNTPRKTGREGACPVNQREEGYNLARLTYGADDAVLSAKQLCPEKKNMERDLGSSSASAPGITMLSPFPPEMGGCLTKESAPDDGLGLESEHSGEDPASECCSNTASEGSSTTPEATTMEDQANGSTRDFSSAESLGSDSTIVEFSRETVKEDEAEDCKNAENDIECRMDGNDEREGERKDEGVEEDSIEEAILRVKRDSSLDNILPALPEDLDIPAPLGNSEEADEEDSEDSDESDEELRSYSVQEQSEESEEEFTTVPVVVSERSSARHLRSLLKMPSLLTQSFCDELERKKKAVSFFDDVTVFLFDQESPTGELAEYTFPPGAEPNGQAAVGEQLRPQSVGASDNSSDGNVSEESGGFEWEEDFPSPSTLEPASDGISTPPNSPVKSPDEKPEPQFSRFSVSRFSITQVSDSDMDNMGGSGTDGERE